MKALLNSKKINVDLGLLVLRITLGVVFMYHGYGKLIHPEKWQWYGAQVPFINYVPFLKSFFGFMAMVAEFFGGLCLVLGLFTRTASLLIMATMITAFHFHYLKGEGLEKPLVYGLLALSVFFTGRGNYGPIK